MVGSNDDGEGDGTRVVDTADRAPLGIAKGSFVGGKVCGEVGAFDTGGGVGAFDGASVGNADGKVVGSDVVGSAGIEMPYIVPLQRGTQHSPLFCRWVRAGAGALPCAPFACCFFVPLRPSSFAVVDF